MRARAQRWKRYVTLEQRETTLILPNMVSGRYLRVQLPDTAFLSLAEVQIYSESERPRARVRWGCQHCAHTTATGFQSLESYWGGCPVAAGQFRPDESLVQAMANATLAGVWTLQIRGACACLHMCVLCFVCTRGRVVSAEALRLVVAHRFFRC